MDCIFCKIGKGEIPADKLLEDEYAFAVLDIHPHAPGHAMVVPKAHRDRLTDLSPEEIGPVFSMVQEMEERLGKVLSPGGFTIGINDGDLAGRSVPHLHIHVIPRFEGDGGGSVHSVVKNAPEGGLEEIAEKIKQLGDENPDRV